MRWLIFTEEEHSLLPAYRIFAAKGYQTGPATEAEPVAFSTKTAGHYLRCPTYGNKTIGNLYNTILQASGFCPQNYFGQPDPSRKYLDLKGPLAELIP